MSDQTAIQNKQIGKFGTGRPDFRGRWPRGEALGKEESPQVRAHLAEQTRRIDAFEDRRSKQLTKKFAKKAKVQRIHLEAVSHLAQVPAP